MVSLPRNDFKRRIIDPDGGVVWGMFLALADPVAAEICAGAGFDFVVIDNEHGPNDMRTVLGQLQAVAPYPIEPAVRVWHDEPATIKRILDLGARTLVVPMIESADQARAVVRAARYNGDGIRGAASARAARWGRIAGYHAIADEEICVIAQIESSSTLPHVEEICAVDGVDAAFVGPMDLATSLGHPGGATLPETVALVEQTIARIAATGTAPGVVATSPDLIERYTAAGARIVGVGVDTATLAAATSALRDALPDGIDR